MLKRLIPVLCVALSITLLGCQEGDETPTPPEEIPEDKGSESPDKESPITSECTSSEDGGPESENKNAKGSDNKKKSKISNIDFSYRSDVIDFETARLPDSGWCRGQSRQLKNLKIPK